MVPCVPLTLSCFAQPGSRIRCDCSWRHWVWNTQHGDQARHPGYPGESAYLPALGGLPGRGEGQMERLFSAAPEKTLCAPLACQLSSLWASKPPRSLLLMETWQMLSRNVISFSKAHSSLTDSSDEGTLLHVDTPAPLRSLLATPWKRARRSRGLSPIASRSQAGHGTFPR